MLKGCIFYVIQSLLTQFDYYIMVPTRRQINLTSDDNNQEEQERLAPVTCVTNDLSYQKHSTDQSGLSRLWFQVISPCGKTRRQNQIHLDFFFFNSLLFNLSEFICRYLLIENVLLCLLSRLKLIIELWTMTGAQRRKYWLGYPDIRWLTLH